MSSLAAGLGAEDDEEVAAVLGGGGWPVVAPPPPQGRDLEPARLRRNTCYIVLAVLLNEEGEVLMMQEAKRECHGRWYLPAGRMEPRETIVEAMRREVEEETGLQCQPLTLLAVEERGPAWIRFVFLARPTGAGLDASKGGLELRGLGGRVIPLARGALLRCMQGRCTWADPAGAATTAEEFRKPAGPP